MAVKSSLVRLMAYVAMGAVIFSLELALTGLAYDLIYTTDERCHLHEEFLKRSRVPILVGLRGYPSDYSESQNALFPNSNKLQ